jgi:dynein heavy chain
MYYDVVVTVEPKKAAVRAAQQRLADANAKKAEMDELVAKLNEALAVLQAQFQ